MAGMETGRWEGRVSREKLPVTLSDLEPSYYWGRILEQQCKTTALNQQMGITMPKGILFVGPEGNGKHTTAQALMEFLRSKKVDPYPGHITVSGGELDTESEQDALTGLDALLSLAESQGRMCIALEDLGACRHGDKVQLLLARRLSRPGAWPWFLLLIAQEETEIRPQLRRQLQLCRCPNPDRGSRQAWLEQRLHDPVTVPIRGLNMEKLVQATEGFSWHQLTDFHLYLRLLLKMEILDAVPPEQRQQALQQGSTAVDMDRVLALTGMVRGEAPEPLTPRSPLQPAAVSMQAAVSVQAETAVGPESPAEAQKPRLTDQEYIERLKHPQAMSLEELMKEMTPL